MRTVLEDAVRSWLGLAGSSGGIPNADRAVIFADQDVSRPAQPYLVVKVVVYDIQVHEDQDLINGNGAGVPTWQGRGNRTSTVSVNAYGSGAEAWLERAAFMLRSPPVRDLLSGLGIAIRPEGGLNNLSQLLDESTQVRFERDFAVDYERNAVVSGPAPDTVDQIELGTLEHVDEFGDRVITVTEVI